MKLFTQTVLFSLILVLLFSFGGCREKQSDKNVDYSQYSFTNVLWTRRAQNDIETIRFGSDGSFRYSCACGNPVNDSDLNEGYTYDDKTKTITIRYVETTEETISKIKIEMYDNERIKLNFNGEIREFVIGLS